MRTALAGAGERLLVLPCANQFGIAGEEDVGHLPAVEVGRAGVDGRGDQALLETVGQGGGLVGKHAGDEADDAVREEGRRNLPAAHYEVAHGDLAGDEVFADAFVNAFIVTAQDEDVFLEGQFVGDSLVQDFPVRGHVDDLVVVALGLELLHHAEHRLDHHHHARVPAVAIVVHRQTRAEAVLAEVVDMDFHQPLFDGAAGDGMAQRTLQEFRYDGEDIDAHAFSFQSCKCNTYCGNFVIFACLYVKL